MTRITRFRWRSLKVQAWISALSSILLFLFLLILFQLFSINHAFIISGVVVLLAFGISFITGIQYMVKDYRQVQDRVEDITAFVKTLTRGKLSHRVLIKENDVMSGVAQALNDLADQYERQVSFLQRMADEKATLSKQAKHAAVIEERQRLARDLHDAVSQQLFALTMLASAAERTVHQNPVLAAGQLNELAEISLKAQGEMRALLLHLKPVHLNNETLEEGIKKLIHELSSKTSMKFDVEIGELNNIPPGVEEHVFRLCQESLSNVLRHSQATVLKLRLNNLGNVIHLKVFDNGLGFDILNEKIASYGLKSMKERCEEIGGKWSLTSKQGQGTAIDIRIPFKNGVDMNNESAKN